MAGTVTIASVRVHGIRQLLVYCLGKREGDWPCHHSGKLPIDRFQAEEVLSDIERRCRCTVCGGGELICGPTTASSKLRGRAVQGGWCRLYKGVVLLPPWLVVNEIFSDEASWFFLFDVRSRPWHRNTDAHSLSSIVQHIERFCCAIGQIDPPF
jgi:hypothetical protein